MPVEIVEGTLDANVIRGAAVRGNAEAGFAIVEFSDYQCTFCARFADESYPQIQKEFVDTGKAKYVVMNYPLEHVHPSALRAAEVAECLGEQGKYWDIRDRLFKNQLALGPEDLVRYAGELGADRDRLNACLENGMITKKIRAQQAEAQRLGINATPTFVLGRIDRNGRVQVARRIVGGHPIAVFRDALQGLDFWKPTKS
jgi:protein-disulfide isomerase